MAEFNQYHMYSLAVNQALADNEDLKYQEFERVANAFINFHKPATYEERKQFVRDALMGRNCNRTIAFSNETMDFEFTEEFVRVTLHSPVPARNNKFFQYALESAD